MSNNERIYRIDQLLNDRKIVSFQDLLDRLEVSPATLKRDLAYMRDRLRAPIIFDRELNGYRFDTNIIDRKFELPGLWFSSEEIYALLTMQQLLSNLDADGLLNNHIKPLQSRLLAMLDGSENSLEEIEKRIKIERIGSRHFNLDHFQEIGFALIKRKRLAIQYLSRSKNEKTIREISPQRLIYYRDNWYLDAWCHKNNGLRSFSVDAIKQVQLLEIRAINIEEIELDLELGSGYGIFAGKEVKIATLVFTATTAKWVANHKWHSNQEGSYLENGNYELRIPYSDPRELIMDVLRFGSGVKIESPSSLRNIFITELNATLSRYRDLPTQVNN